MVVGAEWRILQYIRHTGASEHIQFAPHLQVVHRTLDITEEVYVSLAVSHRLRGLLRVYQEVVFSPHAQRHLHGIHVGEVDVSVDIQRIVVVGIQRKVLQQQIVAHDSHRVVVHPQVQTIRHTGERSRIEIEFTVDLRRGDSPLHSQFTVGIAIQTEQFVGDKAVDDGQRKSCQGCRRVD